jgi:hypothetical protein
VPAPCYPSPCINLTSGQQQCLDFPLPLPSVLAPSPRPGAAQLGPASCPSASHTDRAPRIAKPTSNPSSFTIVRRHIL